MMIFWIRRTHFLALLIASAVLFSPVFALASRDTRTVGIGHDNVFLHTTFSFRDIFSNKVRKNLKSGLTTRVFIQIALKKKGGKTIAYWARTIDIVYDLWEEHFSIIVTDPKGKRRARVKTVKEVVNLSGVLWKIAVAEIKGLKTGKYRLEVLAEVNPVSDEMVRNIQRWITRPASGHSDDQAKTNFFGAFVGHFIDRKIGKADKTVTFTSQWFKLK